MSLHTYLPQDRLRALALGQTLPDRTTGAALFADISGFSLLTEALRDSLGPRRGAEELTKQLDTVYTALITEIESYGGSVIGFAGDAITCWFDGAAPASQRAATCAFALQRVMQAFQAISLPNGSLAALTLKVAVASGPARRFVVGDPSIHYLDVLAGATVARTSTAEQLAQRGEILLDEATVQAFGSSLIIKNWCTDLESGERFAVADRTTAPVPALEPAPMPQLAPEKLRDWLHKTQVEREQSFATEFRPCAALFVRFRGIDYDLDSAADELDAFIRQVQSVASRYAGTLMDITIGDKGSYVYLNFGALSVHEDDARRAVRAAIELRNKTGLQLQMGITQGLLRVGSYGGPTRKTFGALGDAVNLAARLMTLATTDEILLSSQVHKALRDDFVSEPRSPLQMKGKAGLLPVFAITGERNQRAIRLQEPNYSLPMVGRQSELKLIHQKLILAAEGKSQIIGILAEAGLGKSRLVAEVIHAARKKGFVGYGGACQSDALNTPYQVWKSIWQAFFDVDLAETAGDQLSFLRIELANYAPSRLDAIPLLNVVLDLNIPENDFTKNLEPKIRQSTLHALLEECLKTAAHEEPLLIVIEDMHWMDALSQALLEQLAQSLANYPVVFLMAYRPPQLPRLAAPRLEALPQFTRIELPELTHAEAGIAIRARLGQLYPAWGGTLPVGLVDTLMARSQGNPFYLEELLNYVRDRGLDPADLTRIELPDSLHTLILSRIDQLSESQKTTLRVASIVGRLFRARWLTGYYPELGAFSTLKATLDALAALEITPLDSPEPDLAYLFKHIVTHEVTYESLPFATRAKLHEQLAGYLESQVGAEHAPPLLETLAFHYGRSHNTAKYIEYLRKAGESAQKNFANDAALEFYGTLLGLLTQGQVNPHEHAQIYMQRGQVLEFMGRFDDAEADYRAALLLAGSVQADQGLKAGVQFALGKLNRQRADYEPALEWLALAQQIRAALQDSAGMAQTLIEMGTVLYRQGQHARAREILNAGLVQARKAGDRLGAALALNNLGGGAYSQGDYAAARAFFEESLNLRRELGDKWGIAASLNNLGILADGQGDYPAARALYEESLSLKREMGDQRGIASSLNNLGVVALSQADYPAARALFEEGLQQRAPGDKDGIAASFGNLGIVALAQGDHAAARAFYSESLALCQAMDEKTLMAHALIGLGFVDMAASRNTPEAREHILHSLRLRQEMGEQLQQTSNLVGVAWLALQAGDATQAAQWLGAVDSALKTLDVAMEPDVMHFHAQTLAAVRSQLGPAAFQSAWQAGQRLTLEEAVELALRESET
ncbi:MAG: tetratricopeptide repeat protein [Chloroflexota bacterium]